MERLFVIVATVLFTGTARAADFFEGADPISGDRQRAFHAGAH